MEPSLENDSFFLHLVKTGKLKVYKNGKVVNPKSKNELGTCTQDYMRIGYWDAIHSLTRTIVVHRLVWLVFNGKIPKGYVINHMDGNKRNNRLSNLEMITHAENIQHAYNLSKKAKKKKNNK